ncbi:MAG: glycosyltransferase family 2 protein [Verrucomicrobiae bacterium]|nr:glycosyltransferase family 2 protein [Verrucomicrobiae bacterium]
MPPVPAQITIVVPLFEEAANVAPLVTELIRVFAGESRPWELVLVDDGSRDGTWTEVLAAQATDPRVRGIRHRENRGQSAAVWTGIIRSDAPLLCTLDGDLQNDPSELPRMLSLLDSVDFVCGHRVHRRDSRVRRVSSRVARVARRLALGADFADTGCALRAFRRECLAGVFLFNGLHRFLPILVAGGGFRCREVPVMHRARTAGVSKYGVWNRLGRGLFDLLGVAWYQRRRVAPVVLEDSRRPTDAAGATIPVSRC